MKKLLLMAFIACAVSVFAQEAMDNDGPWMVCGTDVSGLKNVAKKTVLKAAKAKKGALYEKGFVYEDMQNITALGSFNNVQVDVASVKGGRKNKEDKEIYPCYNITYIVKEKPVFDKLIYRGRKHLSKSSVTEAMTLKLKDPYNEAKLTADMEAVKNKYAEKGYINASVTYETKFSEAHNTAEITLIINEGERARVDKVVILGPEIIPAKKLLKKTANRPDKVFKPQNLQKDYVKMTLYGRNKGFSEFEIKPPKIEMSEDKSKVSITYQVQEGVQAHYGKSAFEGNTVFSDAELAKNIFYREGNAAIISGIFSKARAASSLKSCCAQTISAGTPDVFTAASWSIHVKIFSIFTLQSNRSEEVNLSFALFAKRSIYLVSIFYIIRLNKSFWSSVFPSVTEGCSVRKNYKQIKDLKKF
ncbi:hypothetical protein FACS189437_09950 [Bacteroidia bacterium]|nr:hypothetical protein FACS189437_09950 [Bacteroidia bacterium]